MRVFEYRRQLIVDYAARVRCFIDTRIACIREHRDRHREARLLWTQLLVQLNLAFELGRRIADLVDTGVLRPGSSKSCCREKDAKEVQSLAPTDFRRPCFSLTRNHSTSRAHPLSWRI